MCSRKVDRLQALSYYCVLVLLFSLLKRTKACFNRNEKERFKKYFEFWVELQMKLGLVGDLYVVWSIMHKIYYQIVILNRL